MTPVKKIITLFSMFVLLLQQAGAEVSLELSRTTISMDETVTLNLRAGSRGMFRSPDIPLPDGLEIRGTSQQTSIINGQAEFTLAYTIAPQRPGTYQIGPYRLENDDVIPAQTLTVTPAKAVRATSSLFATLEASASEALIRQTVELTLTFYSEDPLGDINLLGFPEEGFEISDWQEIRAGSRVVDGKRYRQKRYVARLTPTQPGVITFDPTFRVEVQEPGPARSMLFGNVRVRTERIQLKEPVTLTITAPPQENRPEDYAGHIGSFRLNAGISPNTVEAGDPITLRVTLEGNGSLKQALPPHYESAGDLKVYKPRLVTEDLRRDGLGGRKVLEQVVIPTSSSVTQLPELSFHFYHPESGEYRTLTAGPFPITVTGESEGALSAESLTLQTPDQTTERLGEDLVYIKRAPGHLTTLKSMTPSLGFATGAGMPFVLWALGSVWLRRSSAQGQSGKQKRKANASRELRQHLSALEHSSNLWGDIWNTLSTYLQDRLSLPAGKLGADEALAALPDSVSDPTREQLRDWIQTCERVRFAGAPETNPQTSISSFSEFMTTLDREVDA